LKATGVFRVLITLFVMASVFSTPLSAKSAQAQTLAPGRPADGTVLPLTGFYAIVVDGGHGHVFVTGGSGDSTVAVLDFAGSIVATITNETAASGMTLSSDGATLFVALQGRSAIDKISTSTLARTGAISLGQLKSSGALTLAGGLLWFGYGTCGMVQGSGIGSVDPVTGTLHKYTGMGYPQYCPALVSDPTDPDRFFGWDVGLTPVKVWEFDASTTPPTLLASGYLDGGGNDFAVTPDGSKLLGSLGSAVFEYNTSDLSYTGFSYPTGPYANAVETTALGTGYVIAGSDAPFVGDNNIFVFPLQQTTPTFTFDFGNSEASVLSPGALALSPDGSELFAVTEGFDDLHVFNVLGGPLQIPSTLSVSASPNPVKLGNKVSLSGSLAFTDGSQAGDQTIHISRQNPDGTSTDLPNLISNPDGTFSTDDTPPSRGAFDYIATFDGDVFHAPSTASILVYAFGPRSQVSDFNGDGYGDLAVGVPGEDVGTAIDTGGVNVLYGSATGLNATSNQFWDETATGTASDATGDLFGWAIATGDFNGDGYADLAIGVPGSQVGASPGAGFVSVLYGSPTGLVAAGSQVWHQDVTDIQDVAEAGDVFGYSVAIGDMNDDGFDDLVAGVPGEDVGAYVDAGAANVIYGSLAGLTASNNQFWNQDSSNINDKAESGDVFGFSVAIGDFDGNGFADLLSGIPGEDLVGSVIDGGAVSVIYGTATSLDATGDQYWHQNSTDINDSAETGDEFGFSVAAGDIDGDGFGDLVAGVPFEDVGTVVDAGAANVIFGTSTGLSATGDQYKNQNSVDILDTAEKGDQFGFAVAIGDFDGDGFRDLAAGAPGEDLTPIDVGAVNAIYGAKSGLTSTGNQFWDQNSTDINDKSEKGDQFGYSLAAGDFGNGIQADLVVGVTFEDIGTVADAGGANVIYGAAAGLSATGDQFWYQNSADILDTSEAGDEFGFGESRGPGGRPGLPG
jgi:hypothetical protein